MRRGRETSEERDVGECNNYYSTPVSPKVDVRSGSGDRDRKMESSRISLCTRKSTANSNEKASSSRSIIEERVQRRRISAGLPLRTTTTSAVLPSLEDLGASASSTTSSTEFSQTRRINSVGDSHVSEPPAISSNLGSGRYSRHGREPLRHMMERIRKRDEFNDEALLELHARLDEHQNHLVHIHGALAREMPVRPPVEGFTCPLCGKIYATKSYLKNIHSKKCGRNPVRGIREVNGRGAGRGRGRGAVLV